MSFVFVDSKSERCLTIVRCSLVGRCQGSEDREDEVVESDVAIGESGGKGLSSG